MYRFFLCCCSPFCNTSFNCVFRKFRYCASYRNSYCSMNSLKAFKVACGSRSGLNWKFCIAHRVVAVSNSFLYPRYHILIRSYNERKLQQGVIKHKTRLHKTLRENWPYFELFWSVFSHSWTEYGLRIHSECGKIRTRITPNINTFYPVKVRGKNWSPLFEKSFFLQITPLIVCLRHFKLYLNSFQVSFNWTCIVTWTVAIEKKN